MNILAKLFGVDGAFTAIINGVLDRIGATAEQKLAFQQHMQDLAAQADQGDRDLEAKLNDIAGQNIRTETSSGDSFVRRARPAFLWAMEIAIFFNIMVPLLGQRWGLHPVELPTALYDLFGAAFLGYVAARSYDKKNGKA